MKKENKNAAAATIVAAAAVLCSMTACKGRTMENMQPTGDTVEVTIGEDVESALPDSAHPTVAPAPDSIQPKISATIQLEDR